VQVDPTKPKLKEPGTKPLNVKHDERLSNFALNFNLRCYTEGEAADDDPDAWKTGVDFALEPAEVLSGQTAGAYTRPLFGST